MSSPSPLFENLIELNYSGLSLPPLWQVIYQEAVRGHHLLFKRSDVELFDAATGALNFEGGDDSEAIDDTVLALIACSDLQPMIRLIDGLPMTQRRALYAFYRHALWSWTHYARMKMN